MEALRALGALGDGEAFWHTDSSFTEMPISASLLHAIEVTVVWNR
jgi:alpha-ketoglutarate-dependent taurine dioxygenase